MGSGRGHPKSGRQAQVVGEDKFRTSRVQFGRACGEGQAKDRLCLFTPRPLLPHGEGDDSSEGPQSL